MKAAQQQHDETARGFNPANPRANTNPPCPTCAGRSVKVGSTQGGKKRYLCKAGCGTFLAQYYEPKRYPCPTCGGPSRKLGHHCGKQRYGCLGNCGRSWQAIYDHDSSVYPWCVACREPMKKAGKTRGFQHYQCRSCRAYCKDGPMLHKIPIRARRRLRALLRWEESLEAIKRAVSNLPPDVREEVMQDMAVAALSGELDPANINNAVPFYRRKAIREMSNHFKFVSLSQPIADGLTIGDTLAG